MNNRGKVMVDEFLEHLLVDYILTVDENDFFFQLFLYSHISKLSLMEIRFFWSWVVLIM